MRHLQDYVNKKLAQVPRKVESSTPLGLNDVRRALSRAAERSRSVEVMPKKKGKLIVQMDELWSFVGRKPVKHPPLVRGVGGMLRRAKLLVSILVREIEKRHENYGNLCLLFIVNVLPAIPIFGNLIKLFCLANDIKLLKRIREKPVILKDSTILFLSVYLDSFVKPYLFLKS